ncbi:MAG: hypothetical protein Ct9H300mP25_14600 [Acidobacteriota bacterium]|nr:MAG: hypothetical protein Ct9H300mP25_14600 [Acidobacteriota bacterium]
MPWEQDRFAEVLELRPGNFAVTHHSAIYTRDLPAGKRVVDGILIDDESDAAVIRDAIENEGRVEQSVFNEVNLPGSSKLLSYVPGRGVERHQPGTGKRLAADKWMRWTLHYNPIGVPTTDQHKLGIWFNTKPVTHEVLTRQAGNAFPTDPFGNDIYIVEGEEIKPTRDGETGKVVRAKIPNIPPYADDWKITGITPVIEPITLYALSPHMHLRGKVCDGWLLTQTVESRPFLTCRTLISIGKYTTSSPNRCTSLRAARLRASVFTTTHSIIVGIQAHILKCTGGSRVGMRCTKPLLSMWLIVRI